MKFFCLSVLLLISACSSSPVLYPNKKYESVGKKRADSDVDSCVKKGDAFLKSSKGKQILKSAGQGTFMGSAIGAVTGLLTGDFIQGVASGAAVGAVGGAAGGAITPDSLKQSFVNRCLADKGYKVIGWD